MCRITPYNIIVAVTRGNAIGRNGDMIFHLRDDLRYFKATTMGHPLIMGRRTFQSLPGGALPGRRNIVISRDCNFTAKDAEVFDSVEAALAATAGGPTPFIIGGGQIYAQTINNAQKLFVTHIDADAPADADTFFPEIDCAIFERTSLSEQITDARTGVSYAFAVYDNTRSIP